jgi:hypothetical protein
MSGSKISQFAPSANIVWIGLLVVAVWGIGCGNEPGSGEGAAESCRDAGTCGPRDTAGGDAGAADTEAEGCPEGERLCRGKCKDLETNGEHCGACGNTCSEGMVCREGSCVQVCGKNQTRCDGSCTNLDSDPDHCGACGRECTADLEGATAGCSSGTCFQECVGGGQVCGGECVETDSDPSNCGSCGNTCETDVEGAIAVCREGNCVDECGEGREVCDGQCVDLDSSTEHCGSCGNICESDVSGGVAYCVEGSCVEQCTGDREVCGSDCVDTQTNADNCGSCGNSCETNIDGAVAECLSGSCAETCALSKHTLCDNYDVCTDLQTDDNHCGACGNECTTSVDGATATCDGNGNCVEQCALNSHTLCAGAGECANLSDSDDHCGSCGNTCGTNETCISGQCEGNCGSGETYCSQQGICTDTDTDDSNCGSCGNTCGSGETCVSGQCQKEPSSSCDSTASPFGGGSGTSIDPYQICSAAQLLRVDDKSQYLDEWYELQDHIGINGSPFEVLGKDQNAPFTGVFDGNGYEIRGMVLNESGVDYVGLFNEVDDGKVRNVTLTDVDVTGRNYVGAVAGRVLGTAAELDNITVSGGTVDGAEQVGGVVGKNRATVTGATVETSTTVKGDIRVGGVVGFNVEETLDSSSAATVEGTDEAIGGLVGLNSEYTSGGTIKNSSASGRVEATDANDVGGLIGVHSTNSTATGSTASGEVYAPQSTSVGGVVGRMRAAIDPLSASNEVTGGGNVGGIAGEVTSDAPVLNSPSASGTVTGDGQLVGNLGGLFGDCATDVVDAQVTNVTIAANGADSVGGIVGELSGSATLSGNSYATIDVTSSGGEKIGGVVGEVLKDATVDGVYATGAIDGLEQVGGLVGRLNGEIKNSRAEGAVTGGKSGARDGRVGGLVGYAKDGRIEDSKAEGNVTSSGGGEVGGLVGRSRSSYILESSASGDVTASGQSEVGGLVGESYAYTSARISDSYATGAVDGDNRVGGLVGYAYDETTVVDSHAVGSVTGNTKAGGLVGEAASGRYNTPQFDSAYWNKDTTGVSSSAGGTSLTSAEFTDQTNFNGWDFSSIWKMGTDWPIHQ